MFPNRVFRFVIEGKPPIKRRPRGRTHYTPKETVLDEQRVRDSFLSFYPIPPRSTARFSVELRIYTGRNVDGDNIEKAISDALNKVLWENDRQIKQMWWMIFPVGTSGTEGEAVQVKALEL